MGRSHLKTSRLKDTASPRWLAATQAASWEVSAFWVESVCVCDRAESKMFSIRQKMNPRVALLALTPYLDSRLRKIVEKFFPCVDLASSALDLCQAVTHQEIVFLPGDGLKQSRILRLAACSPLHCVHESKWIPISRSVQTAVLDWELI